MPNVLPLTRPTAERFEPETALDRLASYYADAGLRRLAASDDAYGRMIDATLAGDDAAYEAAKADFWGALRL